MNKYLNISIDNINSEHICCAIGDKKHQQGVKYKKDWLKERIKEGHVFRKLEAQGKVFIEYAPLEKAWTPIIGNNYIYIYCLWVAGSFKGHGYASDLLQYVIDDAKQSGKSGICILSSKKKKPFLSEKSFFEHFNFKVIDSINDYELLALSFDDKPKPKFSENCKKMCINSNNFTIYFSPSCPYVLNSVNEIKEYAKDNNIEVDFVEINSLESAKQVPCIFTNWASFKNGKFVSNTILNKNSFIKTIND